MNREKAEQAMKLFRDAGDGVGVGVELLEGEVSAEVSKRLRRAWGELNAIVALDLMPPIIAAHPDLDLDGLTGDGDDREGA